MTCNNQQANSVHVHVYRVMCTALLNMAWLFGLVWWPGYLLPGVGCGYSTSASAVSLRSTSRPQCKRYIRIDGRMICCHIHLLSQQEKRLLTYSCGMVRGQTRGFAQVCWWNEPCLDIQKVSMIRTSKASFLCAKVKKFVSIISLRMMSCARVYRRCQRVGMYCGSGKKLP